MQQQWTLNVNTSVYNQFSRLKTQGHFDNDQDLLQAAFEALDRQWQQGQSVWSHHYYLTEKYMERPGLSPDDYDT